MDIAKTEVAWKYSFFSFPYKLFFTFFSQIQARVLLAVTRDNTSVCIYIYSNSDVKPQEHSLVNIFKRDYGVLLLLPGAEIGRKGRLEARLHSCFMFCFVLFLFRHYEAAVCC
jgi:hypothetical protein